MPDSPTPISADSQVARIFEWRRGFNTIHLIDLGLKSGLFRALAESPDSTAEAVALGALGAGSHTLALAGLGDFATFGDTSAFIDAVALRTTAITVPEPATGALLLGALGIAGFALRRGRKG